ncbi:MAG: hypothetical protein MOB07_18875 [Acidobacteria bacterium]|nr:hypothetical protein [Acidobacteriota bacterium]
MLVLARGRVNLRPLQITKTPSWNPVSALPFEAPLMLEHLNTPEEYDEGKRHILKLAGELGIGLA